MRKINTPLKLRLLLFLTFLLASCSIKLFAQGFNETKAVRDNNGINSLTVNINKINFTVPRDVDFNTNVIAEVDISVLIRNTNWFSIEARTSAYNFKNAIFFNNVALTSDYQSIYRDNNRTSGNAETRTLPRLFINLGQFSLSDEPIDYSFDIWITGVSEDADPEPIRVPIQVRIEPVFQISINEGNNEIFTFDSIDKLLQKEARIGFSTLSITSNIPNRIWHFKASVIHDYQEPAKQPRVLLGINGSNFKQLTQTPEEIISGSIGRYSHSLDVRIVPGFETDPGIYSPNIVYKIEIED